MAKHGKILFGCLLFSDLTSKFKFSKNVRKQFSGYQLENYEKTILSYFCLFCLRFQYVIVSMSFWYLKGFTLMFRGF